MGSCKTVTRLLPAVIAWTLLLSSTILFFIYPCQFLQSKYNVSIVIFQGVITLFVVSNFFLATFMDPGIIPKASPEEDDDDFRAPLFKNVEVNGITVRMKWCITCKFYRPPRCSHCSECNYCIETFDHHCPWVNNCIGRRNYRHFFFFLVFLSIHMVTVFAWCVLYVLSNKERLYETESIVALVLMALIVLLTIPIIGLTGFHIYLVSRNRTTNEQITGKFNSGYGYNPFTKGCMLNWCYILWGPRFPKYKLSKKNKEFFLSLGANALNDVSSTEKVVRVYLDNDEKSLIQKGPLNNKSQFLFNKSNENKPASLSCNENGSTKTEKIDLVLESISRDCEPSPPATLKSQSVDWQKRAQNNSSQAKPNNVSHFSAYGNPKLSYHYNSPNSSGTNLTSSQSQVLYSQHHPVPHRNLHNPVQQQKQANTFDTTEIGLHMISQPGSHLINHPNFYHQFQARPTSPSKSISHSEISPYAHHTSSSKPTGKSNGQQSGVVVYYSPEETSSLMITDLDSVANSKFASETDLKHLKEHLIYNPKNADAGGGGGHQKPANKKYFFSKRPLSFKKALEITEQLDRNSTHVPNSANSTAANNNNAPNETTSLTIDSSKDDKRISQYDMNYEISV